MRPWHPPKKKVVAQNLAEGKSIVNNRPFVGPTQTPSPPSGVMACKHSPDMRRGMGMWALRIERGGSNTPGVQVPVYDQDPPMVQTALTLA